MVRGRLVPDRSNGDTGYETDDTAGKPTAGIEEYDIALIESLLDRYGVIAAPLIDKEQVAGGFSGLYPVLKRMEEHGNLVRGMFVKGFGAAQFAGRDTVDALRGDDEARSQSCVALDVTDPANLTGCRDHMARTTPYETGAQSGIGHRARPRHAGAVRRAEKPQNRQLHR